MDRFFILSARRGISRPAENRFGGAKNSAPASATGRGTTAVVRSRRFLTRGDEFSARAPKQLPLLIALRRVYRAARVQFLARGAANLRRWPLARGPAVPFDLFGQSAALFANLTHARFFLRQNEVAEVAANLKDSSPDTCLSFPSPRRCVSQKTKPRRRQGGPARPRDQNTRPNSTHASWRREEQKTNIS